MIKKIFTLSAALLLSLTLFAQTWTGGVKGTVVNRAGRIPVAGAQLTLSKGSELVADVKSASDGSFLVENLEDGVYSMTVKAVGFVPANVNVTVDSGFIKDLIFVSLVAAQTVEDVDDSSYAEFDMDDSGYTDTPTVLFGAADP